MRIVIKMIIFFIVTNIIKIFITVNYVKKILQFICYPTTFYINWQENCMAT